METKVQKWGNSLAVRLPKEIVRRLSLQEGSAVLVNENNKRIIIRQTLKNKLSLAELVGQITPENLHKENDWGSPHGVEVW
jgi:antitoxin MazE